MSSGSLGQIALFCQRSKKNGQNASSYLEGNSNHLLQSKVCRRACLSAQHAEPWRRLATAAADHSSSKNRKLKLQIHTDLPKIGNQTPGKMLISTSGMIGSEFEVSNMKPWMHLDCISGSTLWWWWEKCSWHTLGPLAPTRFTIMNVSGKCCAAKDAMNSKWTQISEKTSSDLFNLRHTPIKVVLKAKWDPT